jgi:hypothetical protein
MRFLSTCARTLAVALHLLTSLHGPSVWTGRALQAESDDLEVIGLALLYPALDGTFVFLAIMDIRARSISFTTRPRRPEGPPDHERAGETFFSISSFRLADLGGKPPIASGISLSCQPSLANLSEFIFQTAGFVMRAS